MLPADFLFGFRGVVGFLLVSLIVAFNHELYPQAYLEIYLICVDPSHASHFPMMWALEKFQDESHLILFSLVF